MKSKDLSDLIVKLEVSLDRLAYLQVQERVKAYTKRVEECEGKRFGRWKDLPDNYLEALLSKVEQEIKSNESVLKVG